MVSLLAMRDRPASRQARIASVVVGDLDDTVVPVAGPPGEFIGSMNVPLKKDSTGRLPAVLDLAGPGSPGRSSGSVTEGETRERTSSG